MTQDWIALGSVSIDEFVDGTLKEVSDWVLNFKALRSVAKEAEKLPNELNIVCYKVVTAPVKTVIEEHMKELQSTLLSSLQKKVANSSHLQLHARVLIVLEMSVTINGLVNDSGSGGSQ